MKAGESMKRFGKLLAFLFGALLVSSCALGTTGESLFASPTDAPVSWTQANVHTGSEYAAPNDASQAQQDTATETTNLGGNAGVIQQSGPRVNEVVVDDFATCDPYFTGRFRGSWFVYSDQGAPNYGSSTATLTMVRESTGTSPCFLRWSGNVTTDFKYGYAGFGLDISALSLNQYKTLRMLVRGDGRPYRVRFPMSPQLQDGESNYYGATYSCGDGSSNWTSVAIRFQDLSQEQGWGVARALDLNTVTQFSIQTFGQPVANFHCDISLVWFAD